MPVNIRIQFDNPYATYYAGQTVTGRVHLSVDKPKKIRGEFLLTYDPFDGTSTVL